MKFKFCGNFDCPDWVITEITYLTKITPVKLRIIGNQLCKFLIKEGDLEKSKKILEEMNLSKKEVDIVISLLIFIMKKSAKFDVQDSVLSQELQQLGMPQDNAEALSKVYIKNKDKIREFLKSDIFTFNQIRDINYKISYVLAENNSDFQCKNLKEDEGAEDNYFVENLEKKYVNLIIKLKDGREKNVSFSKEKLGELIKDLEKCSKVIKAMKEE